MSQSRNTLRYNTCIQSNKTGRKGQRQNNRGSSRFKRWHYVPGPDAGIRISTSLSPDAKSTRRRPPRLSM